MLCSSVKQYLNLYRVYERLSVIWKIRRQKRNIELLFFRPENLFSGFEFWPIKSVRKLNCDRTAKKKTEHIFFKIKRDDQA